MIIKSFKAKNVFGYLNFDIEFNDDISFLVGGNGSGKTTALKLMNALVNPSFKDLLQISFEEICLEIKDQNEIIVISAREENDNKILKISSLDSELLLPSYSNIEFYSHQSKKLEDIIDNINREFSDHEIVRKISQIQSPIFLGLDRKREDSVSYSNDLFLEREMGLGHRTKRSIAAKRLIKGSLGISLMETELLVQNSYKRLRELEERQSTKLRDSILLSAFQYSNIDVEIMESNLVDWKEKQGLLQRQKEIKEALSKIGGEDSKLSSEVDKFFNQITSLFEQLSDSEKGLSIEWLLNKAQIERITKIVEIIDEHKSKVDGFFKPINDFLFTINSFYEDSNKKLEIDTVGHLIIVRPNGDKCTIEGLSSGERQLLVIFAHAYFSHNSKRQLAFIIDEPELSLHLKWQEKFAETIFSIGPKSQFILATHSPEIVGVNKDKAVRCR